MFATEQRMGMVLIHKEKIALLRWGNFTSRPFGVALRACHPETICKSGKKFVGVTKTKLGTWCATWMCQEHNRVAQTFPPSLVGFWMAGSAGHLAYYSDMVVAPLPM